MGKVVAMTLAEGHRKTIDILCHGRPKVALPFAGRYRVIDFALRSCIASRISNTAVLLRYQRFQMANCLTR